jgi:hypothetical protein
MNILLWRKICILSISMAIILAVPCSAQSRMQDAGNETQGVQGVGIRLGLERFKPHERFTRLGAFMGLDGKFLLSDQGALSLNASVNADFNLFRNRFESPWFSETRYWLEGVMDFNPEFQLNLISPGFEARPALGAGLSIYANQLEVLGLLDIIQIGLNLNPNMRVDMGPIYGKGSFRFRYMLLDIEIDQRLQNFKQSWTLSLTTGLNTDTQIEGGLQLEGWSRDDGIVFWPEDREWMLFLRLGL